MGIYDLIVLGVVLLTSFIGWRKGLATQVASIVSIVASFAVAVRFREPVAARIDAAEPWNRFAAMLVLYLGTSLVIWLVFRQVRTSLERMKLREFDRQMGAIFGALKGVALASVGTLFAFTLLEEPQREAIIRSRSGVWIARLLNNSTAIMPPEVQSFVGPYLARLEEGFGQNGPSGGLASPYVPGGVPRPNWNSPGLPPQPPTGSTPIWPPGPPSQPPSGSQPAYDFRPANGDWRAGSDSPNAGYR